MDTIAAFAMAEANRYKEQMVFDWEKAARLIKESGCKRASAGLRDDWDWTGGTIFEYNRPVPQDETYTYLASTWAVPELDLDGSVHSCYRMASDTPGWDAHTYWPEEAKTILSA